MPNWVYNSLSIEGTQKDITKIKKQLNKPFTKVHDSFNMTTKEMEKKTYTYSNPIFAFNNIYNHIDDGVSHEVYDSQPDQKEQMKEITLGQMFAGNDWYSWNVRNWGTKWDVGVSDDEQYPDTELLEEDKTSLAYKFNTAWSPPIPAIEKLVEQYPKLTFNFFYEEEQGWGGEIVWQDGEIIEQSEYGWKCRECDHTEDDTPYCETCEFDMCPECGYGEPMDEDRAKCEEHREEQLV